MLIRLIERDEGTNEISISNGKNVKYMARCLNCLFVCQVCMQEEDSDLRLMALFIVL